MKKVRQLTSKEVIFVGGETPSIYQHTGGLLILDASNCPGFGYETFRAYSESSLGELPQFRWRLHQVPLGLDLPYWVEDENFNFDRHLRRIAVPSPGDDAALAELVGYLYSKHMDRSAALWEAWFIEGLADGRFAVFHKVHHCLMDGQGAARLLEYMFEEKPGASRKKVALDIAEARAGDIPEPWRQTVTAAWRLSSLPAKAGLEIYGIFLQKLWQRVRNIGEEKKEKPSVSNTVFNTDIGGDRGLVFCSLPLAEIKVVKDHFGVTMNDVFLALVGGALRDYLLDLHELPDKALRTFIAVSLRTEKDEDFSNKVTTATVTLATDLEDPQQRLRTIAQESVAAKEGAHHGHKGAMELYQMLPPILNTVLAYLAPPDKIASLAGANLLVSNVRAGSRKMYLGGARVDSIYPMSIVSPGMGINVTCMGYADEINVGITIAPELFPDRWDIVEGLRKYLGVYLSLAGKKSNRRKSNPAGSKARKVQR